MHGGERPPRPPVASLGHRLERGAPGGDQRELDGDEERVGQQQQDGGAEEDRRSSVDPVIAAAGGAEAHGGDPQAVHLGDLEAPPARLEGVAGRRDRARAGRARSRRGSRRALRGSRSRRPRRPRRGAACRAARRRPTGSTVVSGAGAGSYSSSISPDELLEHVLEGEDAGGARRTRRRRRPGACRAGGSRARRSARSAVSGTTQRRTAIAVTGSSASSVVREPVHVLHVHDADDVVEVGAAHREAAVAGRHGAARRARRSVSSAAEPAHVDPRHERVGRRLGPEAEGPAQHLVRLGRRAPRPRPRTRIEAARAPRGSGPTTSSSVGSTPRRRTVQSAARVEEADERAEDRRVHRGRPGQRPGRLLRAGDGDALRHELADAPSGRRWRARGRWRSSGAPPEGRVDERRRRSARRGSRARAT